ncbi:MAG: DUF5658 family protein [Phycisphaerales bacterium]|nr:DUF5658 family protein [Phycisphaerales bacterium]
MARAPQASEGVLPFEASTPDALHAPAPHDALAHPHGRLSGPLTPSGLFACFRGWCHRHHWNRRDIRFFCYALAIVLMSVADLKMTLFYVTSVGMTEVNPIARFLMLYGGVCSIILWKSATVACGVFILWRIRRHAVAEVGAVICCAILAALCVHWFRYNDQVTTLANEVLHLHETRNASDWVVMEPGKPD